MTGPDGRDVGTENVTSGTEPIVRVIAEAPDERGARELVSRSRVPLDALAGR